MSYRGPLKIEAPTINARSKASWEDDSTPPAKLDGEVTIAIKSIKGFFKDVRR